MFLCPRHSKNGGGALSVTPVHKFEFDAVFQKLLSGHQISDERTHAQTGVTLNLRMAGA